MSAPTAPLLARDEFVGAPARRGRAALPRPPPVPPAHARGRAHARAAPGLGAEPLLLPDAHPHQGRAHPLEVRGPGLPPGRGSTASTTTTATSDGDGRARAVAAPRRGRRARPRGGRELPRVLPGVRFACDAYVELVRESPLVEAVASSLTEFFAPDLMSQRIAAWEQHYPWVGRRGARLLPHRVPRARARREEALGVRGRATRTRARCRRPASAALVRKTRDPLAPARLRAAATRAASAGRRDDRRPSSRPRLARKARLRARSALGQAHAALPRARARAQRDRRRASPSCATGAPHGRGHRRRAARAATPTPRASASRTTCSRSCARSTSAGCCVEERDVSAAAPAIDGADGPTRWSPSSPYRCPLALPVLLEPRRARPHAARARHRRRGSACFGEAAALGVLQVHLTGGEPLVRADLEALVAEARARELYVNLITSGVPLDRARLARLAAAGLDSVQLRVQDADAAGASRIAGRDAPGRQARGRGRGARARPAADAERGAPPRQPRPRRRRSSRWPSALGAERLELANTQYLGWALLNREALLPSRAAARPRRARVADAARERLRGRDRDPVRAARLLRRPPARLHGRLGAPLRRGHARRHGAAVPPGRAASRRCAFESVRDRPLGDDLERLAGLPRLPRRGLDARALPQLRRARRVDFGGCRCQAFALTGDAGATDPACARAPRHDLVQAARVRADRAGRGRRRRRRRRTAAPAPHGAPLTARRVLARDQRQR